jgi:hypothetical protein
MLAGENGMRGRSTRFAAFGGAILLIAGCHTNTVDKEAFKSAINDYYSGKQECVWSAPVKFPAQVDTSNDEQTKGFDALTDAGLLARKTAEKSRFLIGSKQVTDYDVSDKGRSTWTPDQSQPGYGNFCFGHLAVSTIDNFTPPNADATQYSVTYHYGVTGAPDWANSAEMKTAFPKIASDTANQRVATVTLTKSDKGWLVQNTQPSVPAS